MNPINRFHVTLAQALVLVVPSFFIIGCETPVSDKSADALDSIQVRSNSEILNAYNFDQGNFASTGHILDMAIDGNGFFVLKNKTENLYFRRPGYFIQNADGYLTLGNPNTRLQGIPLWSDQNPYPDFPETSMTETISKLSELTDIRLLFLDLAPPQATTEVLIARNLDLDSRSVGSILYSQPFLHHAKQNDLVVGLMDSRGKSLGIQDGDILTFAASYEDSYNTATLKITYQTTLKNLSDSITGFLRTDLKAGMGTRVEWVTLEDDPTLRGSLNFYSNTSAINDFSITSTRPISSPHITKAFAIPSAISAFTGSLSVTTEPFRVAAKAQNKLEEFFDAGGKNLGLEFGDEMSVRGTVGGIFENNVPSLVYGSGTTATTMQDLLDRIQNNFKLPTTDGTPMEYSSVGLNPAGSQDNIPDGSIVIRGQPEKSLALANVVINAQNANSSSPSPNNFNSNMEMATLREATDSKVETSTISIYDNLGKEHQLTMTFIPLITTRDWLWQLSLAGQENNITGVSGRLSFGTDGSIALVHFDDSSHQMEFDPNNGATRVKIKPNFGGPKNFTGLTQFRSPTTAALVHQNGWGAGRLKEIAINLNGIISGYYTNQKTRPLYQIPLAVFPSRAGLKWIGGDSFLATKESGQPVVTYGTNNTAGRILPGAVEKAPIDMTQTVQ